MLTCPVILFPLPEVCYNVFKNGVAIIPVCLMTTLALAFQMCVLVTHISSQNSRHLESEGLSPKTTLTIPYIPDL